MKKFTTLILIPLFVSLLVTFPVQAKKQSQCDTCRNQENNTNYQTQSQAQNQGQIQNEGDDLQIQERERIESEVQKSKPDYIPRSEKAREHMSEVAKAVEALINVSYQIENQGLGDQIREIAQAQGENEDKTNKAFDQAQQRNAFIKFFIGADYNQLKVAKEEMEQNRLRIQELNRIMAQISNENDKTELQSQIATLERQNTALQDQIDESVSGFSLFGWLFKWILNYND